VSELSKRILTAVIGIPLLVLFIELGGIFFTLLVLLFVILSLREFFNLLDKKGFEGYRTPALFLGALLVLTCHFGGLYILIFSLLLSFFLLFFIYEWRAKISGSIINLSFTFFGIFYLAFLLGHAVLLRESDRDGKFFLYFSIAVTMLNDTGAYFTGKYFGKHKLAPSISPSKTIEGVFGGFLFGIPSGLLINYFFRNYEIWEIFTLSFLICLLAVIGDLAESLLKRDAGVKDSGSFFPGHGGVLDRIDSLLFTIPATYYFVLSKI
jgi:phosphatidate cytidylyltransferase